VQPGHANQSYGLQVAQLAGVPQEVIKEAKKHLYRLEEAANQDSKQVDLFSHVHEPEVSSTHPDQEKALALLKDFETINPDSLSPREALEILYQLKISLN